MIPNGIHAAARVTPARVTPVARGIERGRQTEAELHYEFVPGLAGAAGQGFSWYWMVYVAADSVAGRVPGEAGV